MIIISVLYTTFFECADYRSRVLARFHERAAEISLDNEPGNQQELDTALVLSALLQSKQRQQQK